jgi:hypothetical protein
MALTFLGEDIQIIDWYRKIYILPKTFNNTELYQNATEFK